jgi:hypothetical protein
MLEIQGFEGKRTQRGLKDVFFILPRQLEDAKRFILTYVVELQY